MKFSAGSPAPGGQDRSRTGPGQVPDRPGPPRGQDRSRTGPGHAAASLRPGQAGPGGGEYREC